ncbi:MAG TPA: type 1 glutamine amidotransferase [Phycisphaerales bacterium]|nr:type 1 glutamine amidotransferase [Phycisphaerales bacterium]
MPIVILQHSNIGGPQRLAACLRDHGFALDIRRPDLHGVGAGGAPRDLDNVHGLVIMGGPQNVTDIDKHAWMQHEVELIKQAHARELPVIGICLGAQLIAHALGGTVAPREKPAVGFYPISLTPPGHTDPLMAGIHWNHDQLFSCGQEIKTLPAGATLLASSKHTKHVAFKAGIRTFASIFHFECDKTGVEKLVAESKDLMAGAGHIDSELKVQLDQQYDQFARLSDRLCVNLVSFCFPLVKKMTA